MGDKWMLVIVKQMLIEGKVTFKDFTESEEAIATNILTVKLKLLEEHGIVVKTKPIDNKKTNLYLLTDKGLALTPVLVELATWSDRHLRDIHPSIEEGEAVEWLRDDKVAFADAVVHAYRQKRADLMPSLK
jgi:DNA-binding HxlR family transcriptional regulator